MTGTLGHMEIGIPPQWSLAHCGQVHLEKELKTRPLLIPHILQYSSHGECVVSRGGRGGRDKLAMRVPWVETQFGMFCVDVHVIFISGRRPCGGGWWFLEVPRESMGCAPPWALLKPGVICTYSARLAKRVTW